MVSGLNVGTRISCASRLARDPAWLDNNKGNPECFPVCKGTCISKVNRSWKVKWDFDGVETKVSSRVLYLENSHPLLQTGQNGTIDTQGTAETSTACQNNTIATGETVLAEESDSGNEEGNDEKSTTEAVLNPAFDPEEAKEAEENGNSTNDDLLRPHGQLWQHPGPNGVTVDSSKLYPKTEPELVWGDGLGHDRDPVEYFMWAYPEKHIQETLRVTNQKMDSACRREVTAQEFFQFVGIILCHAIFPGVKQRDLLSTTRDPTLPSWCTFPLMGKYMRYSRFRHILEALTFCEKPVAPSTSYWAIDPLVQEFNAKRVKNFKPGLKVCIDESMCAWKGKDQTWGEIGAAHITKIARKPKGTGIEIKNSCDVSSGVMLKLEVVAGKDEMKTREHAAEYGCGTSLLLRLTKEIRGSGRIVIGDSAFASVKSAVALRNVNGLYFLGLVKTAHRSFPKKYLNTYQLANRGDFVALTSSMQGVPLVACSWNDRRRKNIVATCGTTLPGPPHKKRRWKMTESGSAQTYYKTVPRPRITAEYFDGAQMIDVHNHLRQGALNLESAFRTQRWDIRFFTTILGMIEVDAYLAYKAFSPQCRAAVPTHQAFLIQVVEGLLNNTIGSASRMVLRPRNEDIPEASTVQRQHLPMNLKFSAYHKQRERLHRETSRANGTNYAFIPRQKCHLCGKNGGMYCKTCSDDSPTSNRGLVVFCGPKSGRNCMQKHILGQVNPSEPPRNAMAL